MCDQIVVATRKGGNTYHLHGKPEVPDGKSSGLHHSVLEAHSSLQSNPVNKDTGVSVRIKQVDLRENIRAFFTQGITRCRQSGV